MMNARRISRLNAEMKMFEEESLVGITCRPVGDDAYNHFEARIRGPEGSPYEKGTFTLNIKIPDKYPMEPPHVKFTTPIYHPNIDKAGRICMDMLNARNEGWTPSISLKSLLLAIQCLLLNPNPDDPLVMDIAHEYKYDHESFTVKARQHTKDNAIT